MEAKSSRGELYFAIWIGTGIIAFGLAIYGATTSQDVAPLFALAMIIAAISTIVIHRTPASVERQDAAAPDKVKRGGDDKLALLMSLMDDDERIAFKEALKQRLLDSAGAADGELPYDADTLEALLYNQDATDRLS